MTDSQYWYGSRDEDIAGEDNDIDRVGFPYPANVVPIASNGYVWRCEPDTEGWAYTDLRWRWLTDGDSLNIRIGQEFYLNKYSNDPAQDSLYIKFHLRFYIPSSENLPGDTILLSFAPVGFQYSYDGEMNVNGHMQTPEAIVHTNGS